MSATCKRVLPAALMALALACNGQIGGGSGPEGKAGAGGPSAPGAPQPGGPQPGTPQPQPEAGGGGGPVDATTGGRRVRRMSADQIRATFLELTGFNHQGRAFVPDPLSSRGEAERPDAELLDVFAASLGRPDYNYTVRENLEPGVSFSKFVEDAARDTCGRAAAAASPKLLIKARATDDLPGAEAAIRANVAALIVRFWGRNLEPGSQEVSDLLPVFRAAATAPAWTDAKGGSHAAGTTADGWRAVCIALATDPQFYVY